MGIIIDTQLERQCVWAEAGVLNFKLCDRDFHCEQCPLDAALRDHETPCRDEHPDLQYLDVELAGTEDVPVEVLPVLRPFLAVPICLDVQYSARHIWVRSLSNGLVKCGLDAFGAALLPDDAQIVIVANNTEVREGEEFGWVYGGSHTIPLPAPVSGTVVCRNTNLRNSSDCVRHSPYQEGAIITIAPAVGALAHARLSSSRNHARRIRKRVRAVTERVERVIATPDIGICLNDGGIPVSSLEKLLGEERYWRLVYKFLGGE
jgi:glycine cleavage system H protein